ncbi:Angiopoietin-related protein 2, partial [Varanus komodoensis]
IGKFIHTEQYTSKRTMKVAVCLLLMVVGAGSSKTRDHEGSEEEEGQEFIYSNRYKRSSDTQDKCTYTFIVPQQKVTGAICVNSKEPEILENRVNKQELELLNNELLKQKRQIETLQQLVEVDGGIVNEVKLLRKESRNMNSRVTQLYMQLLHEIIRKRDNALELSQLENKILNQTADMLQLANKYKDLEHKYQHLVTIANNQSVIIGQLEEHCQRASGIKPVLQPPQAPNRVYQPPTYNRIINQISTNEIQSDQNLKALPPTLPTMPPVTSIPTFTDKPSALTSEVEATLLLDGSSNRTSFYWEEIRMKRIAQACCSLYWEANTLSLSHLSICSCTQYHSIFRKPGRYGCAFENKQDNVHSPPSCSLRCNALPGSLGQSLLDKTGTLDSSP